MPSSSSVSSDNNNSWKRNAICSQTAASVSAVIFNPLEVIKLRLMSQDGSALRTHSNGVHYKSAWHAFCEMRTESSSHPSWRIFFRGAHLSALAGGLSHGIYMGSYKFLLEEGRRYKKFNDNNHNSETTELTFLETFGCSVLGNTVVAVCMNPFWFIKTRMQIHDESPSLTKSTTNPSFRSAITCFQKTVEREKSLRVLWRGTSAQLLVSFPSSLHFPLYEYLKKTNIFNFSAAAAATKSNTSSLSSSSSSSWFYVLFASNVVICNLIAKTAVTICCHPLILLRTRLQDVRARQHTHSSTGVGVGKVAASPSSSSSSSYYYYHNLKDTALGSYKQSGLRGFWRGLGPSVLQVVPRSIVHVFLYECMMMMI